MKVIVVEDEYFARKALVKTLGRLKKDIEVMAEFETGTDAAAYLEHHKTDLVITDIRMPEMDGLELSKYIAENHRDTKVMIVTGYADFTYAKQAIQYRVTNYLTKPVKDTELGEAVGRMTAEMEKEKLEIEQKVESGLAKHTLQYLPAEEILKNEELRRRLLKESEQELNKKEWMMVTAQIQGEETGETTSEIGRLFSNLGEYIQYYFERSREYVIILFGTKERLCSHTVDEPINEWIRRKFRKEGKRVTAGSSGVYSEAKLLPQAYENSREAIASRILQGKYCLYRYSEKRSTETLLTKGAEICLYESVIFHNYPAAESEIHKIFDSVTEKKTDIYALEEMLLTLYEIVNRACREQEEDHLKPKELLIYLRSGLSEFYCLEELKTHLLEVFHRICQKNKKKADSEIVTEILEYVERHYSYDVSLNDLAVNRFFMNANYLSRLFKAQTGKNFSKYLIEYRIERAKELLQDTEIKISEVAMLVGFNTTSHFGQTFKKYEGQTPEQFRQGNKEEKE